MPASHLRPLLDEGQRLVMARGVFAVHRVSTAPHHQLLLQRKETLLQTRLPTVSTGCFFFLSVLFLRSLWLVCTDLKKKKKKEDIVVCLAGGGGLVFASEIQ